MSVAAPIPEVPEDWDVIEAGEVCDVQNGYAFKSAFFNDKDGVPIIRIRDVHSGRSDTLYSGPYEEHYVVDDGDLLVGMDGEFRICKWKAGKALLNQRVCRLIPKGQQMERDFLYYSIGSPLKHIEDYTPFTTVKHIAARQIRAIPLPKPPLPEQHRIAQVLSTVQQAIEQQERLIRTTTELKQALMQKLFTEGLRGEAQKETEIGAVPESWVAATLGDLGRVVTGTTPSTKVPEYYAPEEADFVAPADIGNTRQVKDSDKKISMAGYAVCRPLPPDSVMCVCIGATIGKVGMSTKLHSATNQQINSIICSEQHDPRFIYYFLLHHAAYWRGFATFGTMPMLSKGAFEKITVYVPTERAEQSAMADALVAVDNKLEVADKKRGQLQDLFRTLLHELMTGKVRVG